MHKLTLEHLAPYIGYKLNVFNKIYKTTHELIGLTKHELMISRDKFNGWYAINSFKPILNPLSDFKDINSKSMNHLNTDLEIQIEICDLANRKISFQSLSYGAAIECFANKIDVFGLIEKGLAVEGKETNNE